MDLRWIKVGRDVVGIPVSALMTAVRTPLAQELIPSAAAMGLGRVTHSSNVKARHWRSDVRDLERHERLLGGIHFNFKIKI